MAQHTSTLIIDGMSCNHCVQAATDALTALDGVAVDDVRIGEARVQYDDSEVAHDELFAAIDDAGFELVSIEMT